MSPICILLTSNNRNQSQTSFGNHEKRLTEVSQLLQRKKLSYRFRPEYKPAKDMVLADALSRSPVEDQYAEDDQLTHKQIAIFYKSNHPHSTGTPVLYKTRLCKHYQHISNQVGSSRRGLFQCSQAILEYMHAFFDFTTKDVIIFKDRQAVVPVVLGSRVMASIHEGHESIVKCIPKAKHQFIDL